jgi:ribonuclease T2
MSNQMKKFCHIGIFLLSILLTQPSWAVAAKGVFSASEACSAYASKKQLTNPGSVSLVVGQQYPALEADKLDNPGWYRITIPTASPPDRWVEASCGTVSPAADVASPAQGSCRLSGQADGYVLALSWQPTFCQSRQDLPKECSIDSSSTYQAGHFTLHGLWPNKTSCGINYGFCGVVKQRPNGGFCSYPEVPDLSPTIRTVLAQVMPSAEAGSCLERHQWYKHGTCQTTWTADEYFSLAAYLTNQFNHSGITEFVRHHMGKQDTIRTEDFLRELDQALGPQAQQHIKLMCKKNWLEEIQINLPAALNLNADLPALISQEGPAAQKPKSNCPAQFRIPAMEHEE